MNDIIPGIVICGSIILIFGGLLGFFAYLRYLRYRETIELADKGLVHPRYQRYESNGKGALRWGIAITGLGLALCLGLYPFGWLAAPGEFPLNFGPWMLIGLIPTFFGLSLVVIYLVTREKEDDQMDEIGHEVYKAPLAEREAAEGNDRD
jgi:hypothetical protein